jgi:hypothetical protein
MIRQIASETTPFSLFISTSAFTSHFAIVRKEKRKEFHGKEDGERIAILLRDVFH